MEQWQPPKADYIKMNCDGAICCQNRRWGMGVVARNYLGMVEVIRARFEEGRARVVDVEGCAVLLAMKLADSNSWSKAIFESDSLQVIDGLTRISLDDYSMNVWEKECLSLISSNKEWSLSHTLRNANVSAHKLARRACIEGWKWDEESAIPREVGAICRAEYLNCISLQRR